MSSIESIDPEQFHRLRSSWMRSVRQAFLLGACITDREKWIHSVREVGPSDEWSYEFRLLVDMLDGIEKPTAVNVANIKRRLMISDKSPRTILEQCAIWLRISNLETRRAEREAALSKTDNAELQEAFGKEIEEIGRLLDETRERLELNK